MTHREDQDVVGIHPEKMQALIGELKAAHHVIAGFAGEFSAPLSAQGISVNSVHQSAHWTADQVARLTERLQKFRDDQHSLPPEQVGTPGDPGGVRSPGTAGAGGGGGDAGGAAGGGGAGGGSGAGAAGYPAGGAAPHVPGAYGQPPPAAAHAAPHHAADVRQHATLAAKRVSPDRPNLAERAWDDIERNASDPRYAAAFLAALGAAGLAVLGAAIAKRRKRSKDDKLAARRQATLDELTRAARQHQGTAQSFPVPVPGEPGPPTAPPGPGQEPGGRAQAAGAAPKLRLVMADQGHGEPGVQVPAAEGS